MRFFAVARLSGCATHATGDRGVREALDAYREAGAAPGVRHRIEHIETLQPQDLPRFAAEGVVASMQAQHMAWLEPDRNDNWSRRLGAERCDRAFPIRSLRESGAAIALGSDWPVARFDPREGLACRAAAPAAAASATARPTTIRRSTASPRSRATRRAPRSSAATSTGSAASAPGFCADLTVFGEDPVECDADDLPELPVRADGRGRRDRVTRLSG